MSDGMGRELAYLSSHATNRFFIPNWGSIFVDGYFFHMVSFGSFFSSLQEKEQPDVFAKLLGKSKEVGVDMLVGRAEYCNFHSFICNLAFLIC